MNKFKREVRICLGLWEKNDRSVFHVLVKKETQLGCINGFWKRIEKDLKKNVLTKHYLNWGSD